MITDKQKQSLRVISKLYPNDIPVLEILPDKSESCDSGEIAFDIPYIKACLKKEKEKYGKDIKVIDYLPMFGAINRKSNISEMIKEIKGKVK